MIPSLSSTLSIYQSQHRAIPAFNIDSFEVYQAVEDAISETHLPCIVQLSKSEDKFIQAERLFLLVKKAQINGLPIYLNMDHGSDPRRLLKLLDLGYDMVHFDGSSISMATNIEVTSSLVAHAHSLGRLVEAEFNKIELVDNGVSSSSFTQPEAAADFINQTSADFLAVSIGNLHGVNVNQPEHLDLSRLETIARLLPPGKFLTLHGGSGISLDQVTKAIDLGIVKININTDLRLKFKEALSSSLTSVNSEKIYDYLIPAIAELKNIIVQKLTTFYRQGHGSQP